jgi:hypothetical protein
MDLIEVTARFDIQGNIIPERFVWRRRTYRVNSIGRSWESKDGYHILVMTPGNRAHHLLFVPEEGAWYNVRGGDAPTIPRV